MKIDEVGKGRLSIGIVGCLHGNELVGMKAINRIKTYPPQGARLKLLIANVEAMKKKKRFVESDLNRSFPGTKRGMFEERLAFRLTKEIKDCDYIIDIHSTYADMEPIIITTSRTFHRPEVKNLLMKIPISKVLIMNSIIGKNRALIDIAKAGVSGVAAFLSSIICGFSCSAAFESFIRNKEVSSMPKMTIEEFLSISSLKALQTRLGRYMRAVPLAV